jgi:hypothetical protein
MALSFLILSTACGGGGDGDQLTEDEYVQQAEEICLRASAESDALEQPQTQAEIVEFAQENLRLLVRGNSELRELEPPASLESVVDQWLALSDRQADVASELIDALQSEDEAKVAQLQEQLTSNAEEIQSLSRKIGLRRCGVGESSG